MVGNRKLFGAVVPGHNVTGVFECNQMKIVAEPRQRLGLTPGGGELVELLVMALADEIDSEAVVGHRRFVGPPSIPAA